MRLTLKEIKEFAQKNWNLPESEQIYVADPEFNLVNPWIDRSGRFELTNEEAVKEWGLMEVLEFCIKAEERILSERDKDVLCGFIWKHGDKDYSVLNVQLSKEDRIRIEEILQNYETDGYSVRNAYGEKISDIFD